MWVLVLWLCAVSAVTVTVADDSADKEAAFRDLFREMLHIQPPAISSSSGSGSTGAAGRPPAAPRHMLELYRQYTSRQSTDSATTTIRNILPLGSESSKDLVFNVSCVQDTEEVRLAQLQLNRRRLHQRHNHKRLLAPPYRVRLYQATPARLVPLASVPVLGVQRGAWESVDITTALKELLLDPKPSRRLLAVRFESPSGKRIPAAHFLRGVPDTPHAFLVVFTEDSEENEVSEDGTRPAPRPPVHTHAMVQKLQQGRHAALFSGEEDNNPQVTPLLGEPRKTHIFTRNNTQTISVPPTIPSKTTDNTDNTETSDQFTSNELIRRVRSIMDNQLPVDDDDLLDTQVTKTLPESVLTTKTDFFKNPEGNRKFKKGRKGKRKKGKKQKFTPPLNTWPKVIQGADSAAGACLMRKMTVSFSEIGWGDWIIVPEKIDANYCTGSCRYPLTEQAQKPSNHATLQSLVHALGRYPMVPAPACVPNQLRSISVLYFDEEMNVVLRNYPSMIVESCACR